MCGLVGLFGNITDSDKRIFDTLLLLDTVRGRHATGVVKVRKDDSYEYIKDSGLPDSLFLLDRLMSDQPPFFDQNTQLVTGDLKALFGHNRHATVGGQTAKEAHPYEFENVIGMHNGTLPWMEYSRMEYHKPSVTDSEALYYDFNRRGVVETVKDVHGAMACTMWNSATNTMQIFRNSERPLVTVVKKDGSAIAWASESWMLSVAINRVKEADDWTLKPMELPVDTLFSFTLENNHVVPNEEKLEVKKSPQGNFTRGGYKNGAAWYNDKKYGGSKDKNENFSETGRLCAVLPVKARGNVSFDPRKIANMDFYFTHRSEHNDFISSDARKVIRENVDGFVAVYNTEFADAKEWRFYPASSNNLPALVVDNTKKKKDELVTKTDVDFVNETKMVVKGKLPRQEWTRVLFEDEEPHRAYFFDRTAGEAIAPKRNILMSLAPSIVKEKHGLTYMYWLTVAFSINGKKEKEVTLYYGPDDKLYTAEEIQDFVAGTNGCTTCGSYPSDKNLDTLEWTKTDYVSGPEFTFTCCESCREPIPDFCRMH